MWLILQQEKAEDFVIATGITTTVRDFVSMAFKEIGIELNFEGEGATEVGKVASCTNPDYLIKSGTVVVAVDPNYFRPTEVDLLIGNPTKANTKLGWKPKRTVKQMCEEMVRADLKLFQRDKLLLSKGMEILKNDE
jgi:GDPmannose 4,6-dehydratase